jgi:hypothetical protein
MELYYQRRANQKRQRWRLEPVFYGLLSGFAIFGFALGVWVIIEQVRFSFSIPTLHFYYLFVLYLHFGLMLRTLRLASNSVTREKHNPYRWEALVLTGVSGRNIVYGKWWAIVRRMWRNYLFLAFLRTCVVLTITTVGLGSVPYDLTYYNRSHTSNPLIVLIGVLGLTALTMLNLCYTAACGVLAAMERKQGGGLGRAFVTRTTLSLLTALLCWLAWFICSLEWTQPAAIFSVPQITPRWVVIFVGTLLDNGITIGNQFIFNGFWAQNYPFHIPSIFIAAIIMYSVLTWAFLRFAQWRAERGGALRTNE